MEVRCCCTPENLIGHLPVPTAFLSVLPIRELEDGTFAYSSDNRLVEEIQLMPGFIEPEPESIHKKGGKGKSWKKK